ncbi:hypothetical protein [Bosea sp. AK1]|nr:hypothetical protein [Bosea sp. AK1]
MPTLPVTLSVDEPRFPSTSARSRRSIDMSSFTGKAARVPM